MNKWDLLMLPIIIGLLIAYLQLVEARDALLWLGVGATLVWILAKAWNYGRPRVARARESARTNADLPIPQSPSASASSPRKQMPLVRAELPSPASHMRVQKDDSLILAVTGTEPSALWGLLSDGSWATWINNDWPADRARSDSRFQSGEAVPVRVFIEWRDEAGFHVDVQVPTRRASA